MNAHGYSDTPLAKKLGIKPGMAWLVVHAPDHYADWLGELPIDAKIVTQSPAVLNAIHVFVTQKTDLSKHLKHYRPLIDPAGFLWISWPKKTAKVPTDVTEDVIRELALPLGWVDIKVCAVNEVWSGLKLVIRKALRPN